MVVIMSPVVWLLVIGYFTLVAMVWIHWDSYCRFGQGLFEDFRSFEIVLFVVDFLGGVVFVLVLVTGFLGIFR